MKLGTCPECGGPLVVFADALACLNGLELGKGSGTRQVPATCAGYKAELPPDVNARLQGVPMLPGLGG